MKFKEFINTLKKRIVLIPLGTLAAIATIIGVIHQLQPDDKEFENLISDYVNISHHLNRYQVNDSLASDSIIIMLENIQDDIELYIKSISKINPAINNSKDLEIREATAKQNLMIMMDAIDISQRCRNNIQILAFFADSVVAKDIARYVSLQKLADSHAKGEKLNQLLNEKQLEISKSNKQKDVIQLVEEIILSKELGESLSENKQVYIDIYDSMNLLKMKRKHEYNKVI